MWRPIRKQRILKLEERTSSWRWRWMRRNWRRGKKRRMWRRSGQRQGRGGGQNEHEVHDENREAVLVAPHGAPPPSSRGGRRRSSLPRDPIGTARAGMEVALRLQQPHPCYSQFSDKAEIADVGWRRLTRRRWLQRGRLMWVLYSAPTCVTTRHSRLPPRRAAAVSASFPNHAPCRCHGALFLIGHWLLDGQHYCRLHLMRGLGG